MAPPTPADGDGAAASPAVSPHHIVRITLEESPGIRLSPQLENERRVAIFDLLQENHFALRDGGTGPYAVHLKMHEEGLLVAVNDEHERPLASFTVTMGDIRRVIKDYFLVCDSYLQAIRTLPPSRIEAIDMGRRGLHNDGADLLRDRLAAFAAVDHDTARRLFTLICVLHIRK